MKLELRSIIARGDLKRERLTLRAISSVDVGEYLVAQTVLIEGDPATSFEHMIWLPFKQIDKGDIVVVYTKIGKPTEKVLSNNNKAHFFYLDLNKTIWNGSGKGAIVLETPTWQVKSADELERK